MGHHDGMLKGVIFNVHFPSGFDLNQEAGGSAGACGPWQASGTLTAPKIVFGWREPAVSGVHIHAIE
jgi:hypothetical protein